VLPEYRVNVLPSELAQSANVLPPAPSVMPDVPMGTSATGPVSTASATMWKVTTGLFAALWLLTLVFYFRRGPVSSPQTGAGGSNSPDEEALLKSLQKACRQGDASSARKDLSRWIRNHAPEGQRGSMRRFGMSCGEPSLETAIAELDSHGFADGGAGSWKGDALWSAFKAWRNRPVSRKGSEIGEKPELYAG